VIEAITTKFDIDLNSPRLLSVAERAGDSGRRKAKVTNVDIAYPVAGTPTPVVPTARAHWKPR